MLGSSFKSFWIPNNICFTVMCGFQSYSSFKMERQTVPDGYMFGCGKTGLKAHLGGLSWTIITWQESRARSPLWDGRFPPPKASSWDQESRIPIWACWWCRRNWWLAWLRNRRDVRDATPFSTFWVDSLPVRSPHISQPFEVSQLL